MAGGRFGIGTVGPKLRKHPGVVAAGHDLGFVGLAGGGVHVPPLAGVAAFVPVVELVVFLVFKVKQRGIHVAHRGGADVEHDAVRGVEVLRPTQYHAVAPRVGVVDALGVVQVHEGRRALVDPHGIRPPVVGEVQCHGAVGQPKRRHVPPLRAQERWRLRFWDATLSHKSAQADALPAVGLHKPGVACHRLDEQLWVGRRVVLVGMAVGFVAAVRGAVSHHLLRDEVAEGRGAIVEVVDALEAVDASRHRKLLVERHQRGGAPRGIQKAVPKQSIRRVVDGRLLGPSAGRVVFDVGKLHVHQEWRGHRVVRRPGIVAGHGPVVQVPGVNGGAGEVVADGVEQGLVPLAHHRRFVGSLTPNRRHKTSPAGREHRDHPRRPQQGVVGQVEHVRCQFPRMQEYKFT